MSTSSLPTTACSEEFIPLSPKLACPSRKIRKENRFKVGFLIAAPIIGYISIAIATSVVLISVLHHRHFWISNTDDIFRFENGQIVFLPLSGLRQSDVTTLVSLASTLTRFLGSICCGIACWRAAYILLEREGMTLSDLDGLVSFPFLRPWPWSAYRILISCIALLFLSSELYSPILNGSVSWRMATSPSSNRNGLTIVRETRGLSQWFPAAPSARQRLVDQAVVYMGIASGSRGDAYHDNPHSELWSIESATSRLAINSTLANLTIPFFAIDSFEWVTDPEHMLDRAVLNATRYDNGVLNYTSTWNPLVYSSAGYVALLPNKSWEYTPGPINQVLPRTVTSGTYYVAINLGNIDRLDWCGDQTTGQFFSFAPPDVKTYSLLSMSSQMSCIAFARVSLRAGAGICRDCRVASPSVLRNQSEVELVPDYLMDPSFVVMPTVTRALNLMNLTLLPPPPSMGMEAWIAGVGLERYVRQTLVDTYCATWNAFTAFRAEWDGDPIETTVRAVFQVSEASVDRVRVGVWLVLNLCVAMCCVAIVLVQVVAATRRGRRVVVDATLAAVLLDATEVVKRLGHGEEEDWEEEEEREKGEKRGRDVSNMSVLLDSEKKLRVRLRGGERDGAGDHVHLKLVPDT